MASLVVLENNINLISPRYVRITTTRIMIGVPYANMWLAHLHHHQLRKERYYYLLVFKGLHKISKSTDHTLFLGWHAEG